MPDLRVRGLRAWYGESLALRGLDLDVPEGQVVGLLGRNGAGKTTTLRSIMRIHRRVEGEISLGSTDLVGLEPHAVARAGVSLVGETAPVYGKMTVAENLRLAGRLTGKRRAPQLGESAVADWFPALAERRGDLACTLSGGQRRMLALAVAFCSQPRLLLLDEPSGGLSDDVAVRVFEAIAKLCSTGITALIAEQRPELLARFVPKSYLLDEGVFVTAATATRTAAASATKGG